MTNQDPIADREAKIAALQASIDKARECLWRVCGQQSFRLKVCIPARPGVDDDCVIADGLEAGKEAVALMRSAPDGDAAAEIARLRAENERLQAEVVAADQLRSSWLTLVDNEHKQLRADLAAARVALGRISEAVCPAGWTEPQDVVDRVLQRVEQRKQSDRMYQKLVDDLNADLAAARADQAAMARRTGYSHCKFPMQCVSITTIGSGGYRSECTACGWKINGGVSPDSTDAVPAQQPEPEPDSATRDGDEVLRELAQWAGGEGTNELWRAVAELCRAELCRRELARGGK